MNVNMMVKGLEGLVKVANGYRHMKKAWSNIFVRLAVFGILVAIIAYFFG